MSRPPRRLRSRKGVMLVFALVPSTKTSRAAWTEDQPCRLDEDQPCRLAAQSPDALSPRLFDFGLAERRERGLDDTGAVEACLGYLACRAGVIDEFVRQSKRPEL